jgi:hypothetical protein
MHGLTGGSWKRNHDQATATEKNGPPGNNEHYHCGIGYQHPVDVHYGRAESVRDARADVLAAAYTRHPERFVRKHPEPPDLPTVAWINKPDDGTNNHQESPVNSTNP